MDASPTPPEAILLGETLAAELGEHPDTLSRWMAHYLGEQMTLAASSTGEAKAQAEARCSETILALWAHRHQLPTGFRPFAGFEPILETLARLHPDEPRSFYRIQRLPRDERTPVDETQKAIRRWLEFAESIDVSARILIDFAVNAATKRASRDDTDALLAAASAQDHDITILRRLRAGATDSDVEAENAKTRIESLERNLERLRRLMKTANVAEQDLTKALTKAKALAAETSPPAPRSPLQAP